MLRAIVQHPAAQVGYWPGQGQRLPQDGHLTSFALDLRYMRHLLDDIRAALTARNWYAGLSLALALPDICGYLDDGGASGSKARSIKWFEAYAQWRYTGKVRGQSGQHVVMLSGADCYALRCAYLHQGDLDITDQRARDVLTLFEFVTPDGAPTHLVFLDQQGVLLLQVDKFCEEMCAAVESWLTSAASRHDVEAHRGTSQDPDHRARCGFPSWKPRRRDLHVGTA
jgi:hypothetical protein